MAFMIDLGDRVRSSSRPPGGSGGAIARARSGALGSGLGGERQDCMERVQFDTPTTSGWGIPLRSVHVRIFFRDRDSAGGLYMHASEVVLSLRND